jgi:uncharacterized iron-regulated membrane protein
MTLRKVLFWFHLTVGLTSGLVVIIMSVTGALLAYEKQITDWADTRGYRVAPPSQGASRLPIDALAMSASSGQAEVTGVTLRANSNQPIAIALGQRTVFVNPYTGEVFGEGSAAVRQFFRAVTDWHRSLALKGENRDLGKAITGAANLAFLFVIPTGFYLWWPRQWTWRRIRAVTVFGARLSGQARDFNWHNVIGFWFAVPLFLIVMGSAVISYRWASDAVYRIVGETPPPRPGAGGPEGAGSGAGPGGERRGGQRADRTNAPRAEGEKPGESANAPASASLDALFSRAAQQMPGWHTIRLRLQNGRAPANFTIERGAVQPHKRSTLTLDRATAEVVRWEPYTSFSTGRRIRTFLRFAHTGEVFGVVGQTIAGAASAGAAVLGFTGMMLSFRRWRNWRRRRMLAAAVSRQPELERRTA